MAFSMFYIFVTFVNILIKPRYNNICLFNVFKRKVKLNNLKFIDIHTHGAFGVDFNFANYDEIIKKQ